MVGSGSYSCVASASGSSRGRAKGDEGATQAGGTEGGEEEAQEEEQEEEEEAKKDEVAEAEEEEEEAAQQDEEQEKEEDEEEAEEAVIDEEDAKAAEVEDVNCDSMEGHEKAEGDDKPSGMDGERIMFVTWLGLNGWVAGNNAAASSKA